MMSEFYDHNHIWEPLAEFHFFESDDLEDYDENYMYCMCSRVFIRDGVKTYYADKDSVSESDADVLQDSQSPELDDHSHVHFSLDTSYKVKCEKDEGASCYCSASHTENCCSTDEHDAGQINHSSSHALQPSDSGADLTYQDYTSDFTAHDKLEKMDEDFETITENEDYLSIETWDKFWAIHGERLIWASWIKKYSDYINPAYLNENNDLLMDDYGIPKEHLNMEIVNLKDEDINRRERKFSYDSKVNPYKKTHTTNAVKVNKSSEINKDDQWLPIARRRSCSEHERIISPRTITGTDSMTNVTKLTLSSYDMTSSYVTSESTPTDDYSVSSSSDDQSNDQTKIANFDEILDNAPTDEINNEYYWQLLWKQHFGDQYALHYTNYIKKHNIEATELPIINVDNISETKETTNDKTSEIECENSEGNSQEMPTVIEVQTKVQKIKLEDKETKTKKKNKKPSNKYLVSVGVLLQNLIKDEQNKVVSKEQFVEAIDGSDPKDKSNSKTVTCDENTQSNSISNLQDSSSNNNFSSFSYDDGDDEPPEETPVTLKRSHEIDEEEVPLEKIKSTFEMMGFCVHSEEMPTGILLYRRRLARLRPPRNKKYGTGKKTYFDDEGNPCDLEQTSVQEAKDMQTDDDCRNTQVTETTEAIQVTEEVEIQHKAEPLLGGNDKIEVKDVANTTTMEFQNEEQTVNEKQRDESLEGNAATQQESSKRRRRQKRYPKIEDEDCASNDMPTELKDDPKMVKYWKKRHSLFHRFDEGIKLDRESWFSVTPENVARHIATKCAYEVVLDAFCGAGGNTIQFARTGKQVIAIDIDPAKIEMAKHNAEIYGVSDYIEFVVGDFFEMAPQFSADMVFLSPPWGGPDYSNNREYNLETMLEPKPASELIRVAKTISSSIILYLPRNSRPDQILSLAKDIGGSVEIEQSYLDRRFVAITAYFY